MSNAKQKLIIILNGVSRHKKKFYQQIFPDLSTQYQIDVWETKHAKHAIELGSEATRQRPFGILAAGGDGTLNQVINGVMAVATPSEIPTIGIIPLGTGNDFARMCGIEPNTNSLLSKIKSGGKPTDLGKVVCQSESGESLTRHFINVASLGLGPDVVKRLFKSNRALGPTLTYFKAIAQSFFSYKPEQISVKTEQWSWSGKIRVVAIANGQSFGHSLYVAPDAKADDGLFSTLIAGEVPVLKFLMLLQKIKSKKKINDPLLHYNTCTNLSITSTEKCWIETEGELAGTLPATIEILPLAIKFFR